MDIYIIILIQKNVFLIVILKVTPINFINKENLYAIHPVYQFQLQQYMKIIMSVQILHAQIIFQLQKMELKNVIKVKVNVLVLDITLKMETSASTVVKTLKFHMQIQLVWVLALILKKIV